MRSHNDRSILNRLREYLLTLAEGHALDCQLNVPVGPYHAQLVDERKKHVIEIVILKIYKTRITLLYIYIERERERAHFFQDSFLLKCCSGFCR